jgi:pimeloyl-ACP methyl ester carboxylesterase
MALSSLLACALVVNVSASAGTRASVAAPMVSIGSGASSVWVLRPVGQPRVVVIFGHGWKTAPPSTPTAWVEQFRPWLDHLLAEQAAVVFPRYQAGGDRATSEALLTNFVGGVRAGLVALGRPTLPLIAFGYSYGASLVMAYAADARGHGLLAPDAVDAIFPAAPLPGESTAHIPTTTRVDLQVGDADTEAGRAGADAFRTGLAGRPAAALSYTVVRSSATFHATHAAPKLASTAAQTAFWTPLDRRIAGAEVGR